MPCADAAASAQVPVFVPSSLVVFSSSGPGDLNGYNALNVRLDNHSSPLRAPLSPAAGTDAMVAAGSWGNNSFGALSNVAYAAAAVGRRAADSTEHLDGALACDSCEVLITQWLFLGALASCGCIVQMLSSRASAAAPQNACQLVVAFLGLSCVARGVSRSQCLVSPAWWFLLPGLPVAWLWVGWAVSVLWWFFSLLPSRRVAGPWITGVLLFGWWWRFVPHFWPWDCPYPLLGLAWSLWITGGAGMRDSFALLLLGSWYCFPRYMPWSFYDPLLCLLWFLLMGFCACCCPGAGFSQTSLAPSHLMVETPETKSKVKLVSSARLVGHSRKRDIRRTHCGTFRTHVLLLKGKRRLAFNLAHQRRTSKRRRFLVIDQHGVVRQCVAVDRTFLVKRTRVYKRKTKRCKNDCEHLWTCSEGVSLDPPQNPKVSFPPDSCHFQRSRNFCKGLNNLFGNLRGLFTGLFFLQWRWRTDKLNGDHKRSVDTGDANLHESAQVLRKEGKTVNVKCKHAYRQKKTQRVAQGDHMSTCPVYSTLLSSMPHPDSSPADSRIFFRSRGFSNRVKTVFSASLPLV